MEMDEVVVNTADWEAMLKGDVAAKARIQSAIDGIYLYFHILHYSPATQRVVTLRDLEAHNIIEGVKVDVGMYRIEAVA